jgi:YidC/Oxa1 family membrane protein insertase
LNEIRNPQHEPGAEQRPIIVFAVIMVLLLAGQYLIGKFGQQRPPAPTPTTTNAPTPKTEEKPVTSQTPPANQASTPQTVSAAKAAVGTMPSPAVQKQAAQETETTVENDLVKIVFTNKGAQVKHWILKKHLSDDRKSQLDMVNARAAEAFGYPLSFFTWDEALKNKLNSALYVASATGEQKAPATLTFEYADGGVTAKKVISLDKDYVVHVATEVTQNGAAVQAFPQWPSGLGDQLTGPGYASTRIDWQSPEKIERHAAREGMIFRSHISDGETLNGPLPWGGVVDQYFAAVFLPDRPRNVKMVQLHKDIARDPNADEEKKKKDVYSVLGVAVGATDGPTSLRLFVGPKDIDTLQNVHSTGDNGQPNGNIEGVVDFGTFAVIAKPLFLWLRWTHQHWVANWGWAIILVTIIINVALFPLRYTGMKSALKQQKIQPEVNAINRRYQGLKITDPRQQEKQREIQALHKREGINPLSGCIPTLIQLPFLWAFYTMLNAVNELRHANWLWIKDLSAPDPWYLLPIGIIVSMFFMQKMTPMTGMDPSQAKMMQFMMPVMIGFFSMSLPAGLGVYWMMGNVLGIVAQYAMNNTPHAREVRAHLAERNTRKGKR